MSDNLGTEINVGSLLEKGNEDKRRAFYYSLVVTSFVLREGGSEPWEREALKRSPYFNSKRSLLDRWKVSLDSFPEVKLLVDSGEISSLYEWARAVQGEVFEEFPLTIEAEEFEDLKEGLELLDKAYIESRNPSEVFIEEENNEISINDLARKLVILELKYGDGIE